MKPPNTHDDFMRLALMLAQEAFEHGETPVGCIIADMHGNIIGRGRNRRENTGLATAHAELEAINNACASLGDWRLDGCSVYVTLEPCPMCAGAVIMSRAAGLIFGASDELTGSCGSVLNLFMEPYGHKTKVLGGILADECTELLSGFFKQLRQQH